MVRIDSTGYSTSSKRGSYSESPIMLGSIGGCELSIPIQESLLRVYVYTYIYICTRVLLSWNVVRATIIHVRCYFNRHRQMGFPCSSSSLPVVNSSFFLFFLFLFSPLFLPVEITKSRRFHHSSSLLRDQNTPSSPQGVE